MQIQFNTDKTISGNEKHQEYFTSLIAKGLNRYEDRITRIEAHLSDENGDKSGIDDMRCLLEARLEGKQPVVVTCNAGTVEKAVSGAIDKLQNALKTIIGRSKNH
jgi:ribosome-associated translation inhibitor RaiA